MSLQDAPTVGSHPKHNATSFKPGQVTNPGGFPASKRKLGKKFLDELLAHFEANGSEAIDALCTKHVDKYCQLIADLIPTEATVNVKTTAELSPSLERLSSTLEFLAEHVERARKSAGVVSIPEPERPLLPAPVHAEKSGRGE